MNEIENYVRITRTEFDAISRSVIRNGNTHYDNIVKSVGCAYIGVYEDYSVLVFSDAESMTKYMMNRE